MHGLRAEYPEQRFFFLVDAPPASFVEVDSLQPTLRWEPFPRKKDLEAGIGNVSDVTYQLRISSDGWYYEKDNLIEPRHTVDAPLKPSTRYVWTVRACFTLDGEPRCTVWGCVSAWEYWSFTHPNINSYRFKTPEQQERR
jgi:hypothetical protein